VSLAEVEAWLSSRPPLRAARGRPRQGEEPILPALMARFAVSRSTAKRLLERLRRARTRANAAVPVSAEQAQLLAALADRYRKSSPSLQKKGSSSAGASQPVDRQVVATGSAAQHGLPEPLSVDAIRDQLAAILAHWPENDALWGALPARQQPPPAQRSAVHPSARNADHAGHLSRSNSHHVVGIADGSLVAREALIEALEAYGSLAQESPAVVRAVQSLLRYLRERQAREQASPGSTAATAHA
jgi:hypothetical protein